MTVSEKVVKAVRLLMAIEKKYKEGQETIGQIIEELTAGLSDKETQDLMDYLVKEGGE